jgi:hypothetical protein
VENTWCATRRKARRTSIKFEDGPTCNVISTKYTFNMFYIRAPLVCMLTYINCCDLHTIKESYCLLLLLQQLMTSPTHSHTHDLYFRRSNQQFFRQSTSVNDQHQLKLTIQELQVERSLRKAAEANLSEQLCRIRQCDAAYQELWVSLQQLQDEKGRCLVELQQLSMQYELLCESV